MKQYLLSVHMVEGSPPRQLQETQEAYERVDSFNAKLQESGAWVFAGGLHPPSTATVVRINDDAVLMTDGPFVEGKEHIGGFWVIQAPDLDAALTWAQEATVACADPVEVRPFQEGPGD
jgi:hypothetical protein